MTQQKNVPIDGTALYFKPISETELEPLFALWSCPSVGKYMNTELYTTLDEVRTMIRYFQQAPEVIGSSRYAIYYGNTVIGSCGFDHYSKWDHRIEIGYELLKTWWGQGLGSEVVRQMVRYARRELNCHRIEALVHPKNRRSIALLKHQGFIEEACLHDYEKIAEGEFSDILLFAKICDEEEM